MEWQFCICGKVIDEFEDKCYWCGAHKKKIEEKPVLTKYDNKQLKLNFGDVDEKQTRSRK